MFYFLLFCAVIGIIVLAVVVHTECTQVPGNSFGNECEGMCGV